jgi:ABC-type transport system involved in multi-copper enzyme maturation permease subunit
VIALVRSEILKIRTTNVWWAMIIGLVVMTGLALAINIAQANDALRQQQPPDVRDMDPQFAQEMLREYALRSNLDYVAANIYTSGQYVGLLLAMIIGILVVTNEFWHQTATPTFLVTPKRGRVIAAKLGGALTWGAIYGLTATAISIAAGGVFFAIKGVENRLTDPDVIKAILLNLLAYGIWAVFGLGLGTLLKNQIASIVTALGLYLVAENMLAGLLGYLAFEFEQSWIEKVIHYLPSGASRVMTTAVDIPDAPQWWAGALALLAYGLVAAGIGTLITKSRDIS